MLDQVYEGEFGNNVKEGEGKVYFRNGSVIQANFRAGDMDGEYLKLPNVLNLEIQKIFNNAR